ncbi:IS3 family transposase [Dactylosporangium sp. NPDC000555]|uniref:IS3 family transposase n=1 Tax=Dactylosporangium sp. NPDC000555 TaxID=3154260 RepID=UPI003333458F
MNVYPFIEAEQAGKHSVKRACELLQVSRSAYYTRNITSSRKRVDEQLTAKILQIHAASNGTYGAPRIHAELAAAGLRHGRKRIARRMRAAGIRGKSPRRWQVTTIPDPNAAKRPDLIGRDFTVDPAAIDTRWCGDITSSTRGKAGCIWPPSSTWPPAASWAGPWPTISRPTWSTPP